MSDFKRGDRVRVTLEGTVKNVLPHGPLVLEYGERLFVRPPESVEKIEPPVETFRPGDFVRHKESGHKYLIFAEGYVSLDDLYFIESGTGGIFTSKRYEKYDVAEVPF